MRRLSNLSVLLVVVVAAGISLGCNERLDDPLEGEGILTIESISPALVNADITPTDPNGVPTPLTSDEIEVTLKNRPRSESSGSFSDVLITKSERFCTFTGTVVARGFGVGGFTIPSDGTAAVTTTAVTVSDKTTTGAAVGDSWRCFVRFLGEDVAGNPVSSDFASFIVTFVDN